MRALVARRVTARAHGSRMRAIGLDHSIKKVREIGNGTCHIRTRGHMMRRTDSDGGLWR
jgi:hypothetical protein